MRNVVLAFNLLSVIYAVLTAIVLTSVIASLAAGALDTGLLSGWSLVLVCLLPFNMLVTHGLSKKQTWAYFLAFGEVVTLLGLNHGFRGFEVGNLLTVFITLVYLSMLRKDFKVHCKSLAQPD